MNKRQCYPCTACCEGWLTSKEIDMAPGKPCQHCTTQGCAIYENRPKDPCKTYRCAWLQEDSELPDDYRPDLCGVIVSLNRKWNGWTVIHAAPTGGEIPPETLEWIKSYAVKLGMPLMFQENLVEDGQFQAAKIMGFGPRDFVLAVKNAIAPADVFRL
jgi:hypothetical protein